MDNPKTMPLPLSRLIGSLIYLDCDWATIPVVERELVDLFSCFDPATEFALQRDAEKPVGIWGSAGPSGRASVPFNPTLHSSRLHSSRLTDPAFAGSVSPYHRALLQHSVTL
jgi:hypothetical protein